MNSQQIWALALPLIVAVAAYVRAELAHHTATAAAAAPAPAPAPAPALPHEWEPLAGMPAADLWSELERRGWSIASQPFPPAPAAAAWPPLPKAQP